MLLYKVESSKLQGSIRRNFGTILIKWSFLVYFIVGTIKELSYILLLPKITILNILKFEPVVPFMSPWFFVAP